MILLHNFTIKKLFGFRKYNKECSEIYIGYTDVLNRYKIYKIGRGIIICNNKPKVIIKKFKINYKIFKVDINFKYMSQNNIYIYNLLIK